MLCHKHLDLLKLTCCDKGDYTRLYSGFAFAIDWWTFDWGYPAYRRAMANLKYSPAWQDADFFTPEMLSSFIIDLSTISRTTQMVILDSVDMSPRAQQEMAGLKHTALNPLKSGEVVLKLSAWVAQVANKGYYGVPRPSPASLEYYLNLIQGCVCYDELFEYCARDLQKGYSAQVLLTVLDRLNAYLDEAGIPCELIFYAQMMLNPEIDDIAATFDILTTENALELLAVGALKLQEEAARDYYSLSIKPFIWATSVALHALRIGACCATVTSLQRPLPMSMGELLADAVELINAWQELILSLDKSDSPSSHVERCALMYVANVFDLGCTALATLLCECSNLVDKEWTGLAAINLNDADTAIMALQLMEHGANAHAFSIQAALEPCELAADALMFKMAATGLLNLVKVVEVLFRVHNAASALGEQEREETGAIYGDKAGLVYDAAWEATLACSERCLFLSGIAENTLIDLHTSFEPNFTTSDHSQSMIAQHLLTPPQTALAVLFLTSSAAELIESDDHRRERDIAAVLKVCCAVGSIPASWKMKLIADPAVVVGVGTIAIEWASVVEPCLISADTAGLELGLDLGAGEGNKGEDDNDDDEEEEPKYFPWKVDTERLQNLIKVAREADLNDGARGIARAEALGHLTCSYLPCSYLGLSGGQNKSKHKTKVCSGCGFVGYCCLEHQKADWNVHKAACKALSGK